MDSWGTSGHIYPCTPLVGPPSGLQNSNHIPLTQPSAQSSAWAPTWANQGEVGPRVRDRKRDSRFLIVTRLM